MLEMGKNDHMIAYLKNVAVNNVGKTAKYIQIMLKMRKRDLRR